MIFHSHVSHYHFGYLLFQAVNAFPMNSAQVGAPIGEGREQKDAIDEEVGISLKHIPSIRFIDLFPFFIL